MAGKEKFYVVWKGVKPGVYNFWEDCKKQIDNFPGALYKAFPSEMDAREAFQKGPAAYMGIAKKPQQSFSGLTIIQNSLSVDAACSGNPGVMEYQGVHTQTKKQIFYQKFEVGTNNIGEFLALVHGLSYLKKNGYSHPIYTDSVNAMKWVEAKKCKTKLERNTTTEDLFQMIENAEKWLRMNNYSTQILKWNTKNWGEIPADFGRKG